MNLSSILYSVKYIYLLNVTQLVNILTNCFIEPDFNWNYSWLDFTYFTEISITMAHSPRSRRVETKKIHIFVTYIS